MAAEIVSFLHFCWRFTNLDTYDCPGGRPEFPALLESRIFLNSKILKNKNMHAFMYFPILEVYFMLIKRKNTLIN